MKSNNILLEENNIENDDDDEVIMRVGATEIKISKVSAEEIE